MNESNTTKRKQRVSKPRRPNVVWKRPTNGIRPRCERGRRRKERGAMMTMAMATITTTTRIRKITAIPIHPTMMITIMIPMRTKQPSKRAKNALRKYRNCARKSTPRTTPRLERRHRGMSPNRRRRRCVVPSSGKAPKARGSVPSVGTETTAATRTIPRMVWITTARISTSVPPSKRNERNPAIRGTKSRNPVSSRTWEGTLLQFTTFRRNWA
mmetsp:Transcript_21052/g.39785  ORF Transcript_21052/g.39785 Transcript_21052/m.39785 type:complete len:213 (+) Transcript_21052:246-884(+)